MYSVNTKQTWVMKGCKCNRDKETRAASNQFYSVDLRILCSFLNGYHLTTIKHVTCTSADTMFIEGLVDENRWDGSTTTLGRWMGYLTWRPPGVPDFVVLLFYWWLAACDVCVCCDSCYIRCWCGFRVVFTSVFYCAIVYKCGWITLVS
jgi:hypothetical protein